jgi:hypothetical protein
MDNNGSRYDYDPTAIGSLSILRDHGLGDAKFVRFPNDFLVLGTRDHDILRFAIFGVRFASDFE